MHIMQSQRTQDSRARLATSYKDTTGHCLELYYIMPDADPAVLDISVRGEDYVTKHLLSIRTPALYWRRKFLELPPGLHQIIIEGVMEGGKVQSMAIDDITVWPCQDFSM